MKVRKQISASAFVVNLTSTLITVQNLVVVSHIALCAIARIVCAHVGCPKSWGGDIEPRALGWGRVADTVETRPCLRYRHLSRKRYNTIQAHGYHRQPID